ncbi:UNVERIFIED_CONTAM: hypothetical protein RMT77_015527 [Armadillidium vulgare]
MANAVVTRLNSGIDIEESANDFGTYMSVYDREITSSAVISHDVRNEVHCRWIQFTLQARFCSIYKDNSSNIECKTASVEFGSDIKVVKRDGATTFIRTGMNNIYWPSRWGLFYMLHWETTDYEKHFRNCRYVDKRRSPAITRKDSEKDIVRKILQDGNKEAAWVGAYWKRDNYIWLDTNEKFDEFSKVTNRNKMQEDYSITINQNGEYVMEKNNMNLSMICVYNIFDIDWKF